MSSDKALLHLVPQFIDDWGLQKRGWKVKLKRLYFPDFNFTLTDNELKTCKPFYNKTIHVACVKGKKNYNGILFDIELDDYDFLNVIYQWQISSGYKEGTEEYQCIDILHNINIHIANFDSNNNFITTDFFYYEDKSQCENNLQPYMTLFNLSSYQNSYCVDKYSEFNKDLSVIIERKENIFVNAIPESGLLQESPFRTPIKEDVINVRYRFQAIANKNSGNIKKDNYYFCLAIKEADLFKVYENTGEYLGEFNSDIFTINFNYNDFLDNLMKKDQNSGFFLYRIYHNFDVGDQSVYFKLDDSFTPKEVENIAVYFQLKIESMIANDVSVPNCYIAEFFQLIGAVLVPDYSQEKGGFYNIDMYENREYRVGVGFLKKEYKIYDEKYSKEAEKLINSKDGWE